MSRMTSERSTSPSSTAATSAGGAPGVSLAPSTFSVARPAEATPLVAPSSTNQTPPGKLREQFGPHRQRQPGLPDSPGPGQRHEPFLGQETDELGDLGPAADQWRELERKVVTEGIQRQERREVSRQVGMRHLPDPLGPAEVLQAMPTEVEERDAVPKGVSDETGCDGRDQDLTAVPTGRGGGRSG